jgi:5-methylcytosine-specific restriction protein A
MKTIQFIVFRYLTDADFFNIYKPTGTEVGGGGQSYIDFKVSAISLVNWQAFFSGISPVMRTKGPSWTFQIGSIGLSGSQQLTIYQRRAQSFTISSQKITSGATNRVPAWHPQNGFPEPTDPTNRTSCPPNLAIYIVRTDNGEFWAGWFQNATPCRDTAAEQILQTMLPSSATEGHAGFIAPSSSLYMDESDSNTPFFAVSTQTAVPQAPQVTSVHTTTVPATPPAVSFKPKTPKTEEDLTKSLFDEDETDISEPGEKVKEVIVKVRNRNAKAVKDLKGLYQGKCQITAEKYIFLKKDGNPYCEAHHLIPLGEEGADSPFNIIIVNPLIHKMLHYADVSGIDLSKITAGNTLDILINSETYTIKWHPKHAEYVKSHQETNKS